MNGWGKLKTKEIIKGLTRNHTRGGDLYFRFIIPSAKEQPEVKIKGAGHFLQEDKGEEIAGHILAFMERTPL